MDGSPEELQFSLTERLAVTVNRIGDTLSKNRKVMS
jgi:hypothetical protein